MLTSPSTLDVRPDRAGTTLALRDYDGAPGPSAARPVRVRLAPSPYRGSRDGGWWPRARSLDEVTALAAELSARVGMVSRVSLNPARLGQPPRRFPRTGATDLRTRPGGGPTAVGRRRPTATELLQPNQTPEGDTP